MMPWAINLHEYVYDDLEKRLAADGEGIGARYDAAEGELLFFLFILIFYNGFLDYSNSDSSEKSCCLFFIFRR